jgi:hypothetical protein
VGDLWSSGAQECGAVERRRREQDAVRGAWGGAKLQRFRSGGERREAPERARRAAGQAGRPRSPRERGGRGERGGKG